MTEGAADAGTRGGLLPRVDSPERTLLDLRFPSPGRKPYPSDLQRGLVFVFIALAFTSIEGAMVYELVTGAPMNGLGGVWGFAFLFGFMGFFLGLMGFMVLWYRGFSVERGVMTLPAPQRLGPGRRARRIQLLDIVDAQPIDRPVPNAGLLLTLRDGGQVRLWVDYASRMQGFLDQLRAAIEARKYTGSVAAERARGEIHPPRGE